MSILCSCALSPSSYLTYFYDIRIFYVCRADRALSKLVSSNDLNKLDGEEKDLEKEETAVIQAATMTFSDMQMLG